MFDQTNFLWSIKTEFCAGAATPFKTESGNPYPRCSSEMIWNIANAKMDVKHNGPLGFTNDPFIQEVEPYTFFLNSVIYDSVPSNIMGEVYK